MITPLLQHSLEPLVARQRLLLWFRWSATWLLAFAALAACVSFGWIHFHIHSSLLLIGAALAVWLCLRRSNNWQPDYRGIARQVEEKHPELHALLLTAVEQQPDRATGKLNFLQQRVISEVVTKARAQQWVDVVPGWKLSGYLVLGCIAAALLMYSLEPITSTKSSGKQAAAKQSGVEVTPGDATIERGSGLVVLASFGHDVPTEATLIVHPQNEPEQRMPLTKNLDDPVFGGGLPEVQNDLTYRVEYAGEATRDFTVKVFEHPRLDRADATLHFPQYTKLAEKKVADTRRVSAVEGSKLEVAFQLNKPVKSGTLVAKDGAKVPLTVDAQKPLVTLRDFAVTSSHNYELQLEDADGRASKVPAQFAIEALPNRAPELKFITPKGDQRVSPIEEVAFRAEVWDDFGLSRYGLMLNIAGRGEQEVELGRGTGADERRELTHLLKLEDLGVKPDELLSWYVWAEDVGPDGKPRRTATDMFFAEVRPFEEIFRPGDSQDSQQQQQQQQQQGAGQATQIAASEKQIINASWKLKRTEDAASQSPTPGYLKDAPVVRDAQGEALKKVTAMAEEAEDAKTRALIETVEKEMTSARDQLESALGTPKPLPEALTAEQAAYNALLKLAAHEFRVTKRKGSPGQQSAQQQAQQRQLDQLEMKGEEKRYETKSEAQAPQEQQQREQLAILNRLKELAQRQQDINERLKELQTALEAAKSEPEKEEIKRQLKRLREEEQQMLADMDESRQKMEQSEQQSQFADERRKLDETRNDAQKAAEAMEQNAASQALASGTRAARNLQQMRDDFRKKTTGQFNDQMRQMRTDARALAENQQALADKIQTPPTKPERRSLDGTSEREQLTKQFEKQQGDLANVTEQVKRVSEQAETAEPLLAKELYDTLRKSAQAGTSETLERTGDLATRGYTQQAKRFEEKARKEIEDLKSGVERAAESVLGDEAEALRQARAELDQLSSELNREIAQARPDLAMNGSSLPSQNPASSAAEVREKNDPAGLKAADQNGQPKAADPNGQPSEKESAQGPRSGNGQQRSGEQSRPNPNGTPGQQPGQGQDERATAEAQRRGGSGQRPERTAADQLGQQPSEGEQQPGGSPSDRTAQNGQSRSARPGAQSRQPGQQRGEGQQLGGQGEQAQASPAGETPGQQAGQQPRDAQGTGAREGSGQRGQDGQRGLRGQGSRLASGAPQQPRGGGGGNPNGGGTDGEQSRPLTGEKFTEWSDRLRNVEEMVDDPALRTEAARIRELATGVRVEFKRHSVPPNWEMVATKIGTPLAELRNRLTEELARRESKENLVPIDRDPVPTKYAERVRRYYEELGRNQ